MEFKHRTDSSDRADKRRQEFEDRIDGFRKDFLDRAQALQQGFQHWRDERISLFYTVDIDEFRIEVQETFCEDIAQLENEFSVRASCIQEEFWNSFADQFYTVSDTLRAEFRRIVTRNESEPETMMEEFLRNAPWNDNDECEDDDDCHDDDDESELQREVRDFVIRCEDLARMSTVGRETVLARELSNATLLLLRKFVVASKRLVSAFSEQRNRRKMLQHSIRQLAGEFLDRAIRIQQSVESNASMFDDDGQLNKQLVQELLDGAAQLRQEFHERSSSLLPEFQAGSDRFITNFCSQVNLGRILQESRQCATKSLNNRLQVPEIHGVRDDGDPLKLLHAEIRRLVDTLRDMARARPEIHDRSTPPLQEITSGSNSDAGNRDCLWVVVAVGVDRGSNNVRHAEAEAREFAAVVESHGLSDRTMVLLSTGGSKEEVLNTFRRGIAKLKLLQKAKLMIFVAGEGHATYDRGALLEASDSDPDLSKTWVVVETEVMRMLQEQEIFKAEVVMFLSLCRVSFTPERVDDVPDHIDEPPPASPGIRCVKIYGCKWNRRLEDFTFIPRALEVFLVRGAADASVLTTWMLPDLYWLTLRKVEMDVVEDCAPTPTHPIMFFAAPKRPWVPLQPPWNEEAIDDLCDSTFLLARHIGFLACHALEKDYLKARHDVLRIAERFSFLRPLHILQELNCVTHTNSLKEVFDWLLHPPPASPEGVEDLNLGDFPRDVLEPMADALVKHLHEEETDVDPHQVVEEVRRLVDQLQQYLSVYTLQELCKDYKDYEEAQQHPQHLTAFVAMGVSSRSAPEPPERRQEMAHEIFRLADSYEIPVDRFYIGPGSLWILLQSAVPLARESLLRFGEDLSKCFQQYAQTSLRWRRASPFTRAPLPSVPGGLRNLVQQLAVFGKNLPRCVWLATEDIRQLVTPLMASISKGTTAEQIVVLEGLAQRRLGDWLQGVRKLKVLKVCSWQKPVRMLDQDCLTSLSTKRFGAGTWDDQLEFQAAALLIKVYTVATGALPSGFWPTALALQDPRQFWQLSCGMYFKCRCSLHKPRTLGSQPQGSNDPGKLETCKP